ncbi:MAG TPA: hypothetical protein VLH16_06715, partial [Bacteroidales bacterium]|nr:hypothetical protein [Bacteroidales bacterium]
IVLAVFISESFALKYALLIVAILQLLSIPLAKNIIKHTNHTIENFDAGGHEYAEEKLLVTKEAE